MKIKPVALAIDEFFLSEDIINFVCQLVSQSFGQSI